MDQSAPPGHPATKPLKPARVALNVLALCFTLSVFGRGPGESFTVFLKPISESFGWDRAQAVSVYSLAALAGGLAAPLIGRLFDRSGPRSVYSLGLLLLGGAFLVAAHSQHLWQFQLSLALCAAPGIPFIGKVPNSILLRRRRGRPDPAAGVATADRAYRLARRLSDLWHRLAASAGAAVAVAMAAVLH